jgi:YHS domain-containing protein
LPINNQGKNLEGVATQTIVHDGVSYYFASEANRKAFEANPVRYVVQNGGFCTFGVSVNKKFDGDPNFAAVVDDKLYVFLSEEIYQALAVFERTAAGPAEAEAPSAASLLVERILAQLPPRDAWLIRSIDLEERPFEELCAEMNWRIATGRVRLFRARRRLKKAIADLEQASHRP